MFESEGSRKYALECLRLETDCEELAAQVDNTELQSHFFRMARTWAALADSEPSDSEAGKLH